MRIAKYPENYTGAFQEVIFTIDQVDPEHITQVEIYDMDDNLLGTKRFSAGDKQTVNIGKYIADKIIVEPIYKQNSGFYKTLSRYGQAYIIVEAIAIDKESGKETIVQNLQSEMVKITAGTVSSKPGQMLSKHWSKTEIYPGEYDEIPFIAGSEKTSAIININSEEGTKTITYENNAVVNGQTGIFLININHLYNTAGIKNNDEVYNIEVEIKTKAGTIAKREYDVKDENPNTVRCAWMNEYGAIDYYTFCRTQSEKIKCNKKRVYGENGYTISNSIAETTIRATSDAVTKDTYDWLSNIIASPKAWRVENDKMIPIDITNDQTEYDSHNISRININFRNTKSQILQRG